MTVNWNLSTLTSWLLGVTVIAAGLGFLPGSSRDARAEVVISVAVFDDTLTPYGSWVDTSRHARVWRPNPGVVGSDFQPYGSNGQWIYTDAGWSWESDWEWGWAPFHYGRWYEDADYGWVWLPGTVWAPAWVDWRYGDNYVGWVPLAPQGYSVTVAPSRWTFVPTSRFVERDFWRHRVPQGEIDRVYSSTTVIHTRPHGAGWYAGPPPSRVSVVAGRAIEPVHVAPPRAGVIAQVHVNTGRVATVVPVHGATVPARRPEPAVSATPAPVRQPGPKQVPKPNEHGPAPVKPPSAAAPARNVPQAPARATPPTEQPKAAAPAHEQQPNAAAPKHEEQPRAAAPAHEQQPKAAAPKHEEQPRAAAPAHEQQPKAAAPKHEEQPRAAAPANEGKTKER